MQHFFNQKAWIIGDGEVQFCEINLDFLTASVIESLSLHVLWITLTFTLIHNTITLTIFSSFIVCLVLYCFCYPIQRKHSPMSPINNQTEFKVLFFHLAGTKQHLLPGLILQTASFQNAVYNYFIQSGGRRVINTLKMPDTDHDYRIIKVIYTVFATNYTSIL